MKQAAYGAELFNYPVKEVPNPHGETTHCRWLKGGNQSETRKIFWYQTACLREVASHAYIFVASRQLSWSIGYWESPHLACADYYPLIG
jgi:hypothetical protein